MFGFDSIHTKRQIVHFIFKFIVVLYLCILRFRGNIPFGAFTSCCNRLRESFRATKLQKVPRKSPRHDRKSDAGGETLKLVSVNFCKNAIFVLRKRCFCEFWKASAG